MSRHEEQLPDIYIKALRRYEQVTEKKLNDPLLLKMKKVEDLLIGIDQRNHEFNSFRATRHTLFKVLAATLKPIELISNLAVGAASMPFPPATLVFAAATCLINAAKGVSASYNAIQDLMESLKAFTVRLSIYDRESISHDLSDQLSSVLVTLIEIFALSRKMIKQGRFVRYVKNAIVSSDDEIKMAVSKLQRLTEAESRLVGAETLKEAKRAGRAVDDVVTTVSLSKAKLEETGETIEKMDLKISEMHAKLGNVMLAVNDSRNEERGSHKNLKQLLQPSVTAQDWYDRINKARVPGTGDWIRSEKFFQAWHEKKIPILWVSGNPGAGKSFISSNIISFLKDSHPQGVQHPSYVSVAYFFFKDDNPKTRSFQQALRDLAYQIGQNDFVYAKFITTNYDSPEDVSTLESTWRNLFVEFFLQKKDIDNSVYIIIDGVDEAFESERKPFLDLLRDVSQVNDPGRIQLIMFGRPHLSDTISETLEVNVPTIHVTANNNSADIVHYIESSIQKSIVLKRVSVELRAEIVEKLSTGAQGMFIWVDLVLQELLKRKSTSAIRKSLNEAPKGLKEMLCHVLESFSLTLIDDESDNLNELLAWVACAQRPLSLGELDTVVKLNSPDGEGMIYLEGALRKQFAAFFSLSREDGLSTAELQTRPPSDYEENGEVQDSDLDEVFENVDDLTVFDSNPTTTEVTFCHGSIGDFLRDSSQGKFSAGNEYPVIGVDISSAKLHIFKTCLNLFCDVELQRKPQNCNQSIMPYAFESWIFHFIAVEVPKSEVTERKEIVGLLVKMFGREQFMENWAGGIGWGFFNKNNVSLVKSWLDNQDDIISLPLEDQDFIRATAESPALIFKPLARYIAKKWLEEVYWLPARCCEIVYGYIRLESGAPLDETWTGFNTAEDIISVAEWAELTKTAVWHRRLGIALREHQNYDESMKHFAEALRLDNTMWLARAGIALIYVSKQEYQKAIELDKITEAELKQNLLDEKENTLVVKASLHQTQERVAQCYEALEDEENCFIYYQDAHRHERNCYSCTSLLLSKMYEKGLYDNMINLLKAMDEEHVFGHDDVSCLTNSLWQNQNETSNYFKSVATAAQKTGNVDYLIETYRDAIELAKKLLKMVVASSLELCIAKLYSLYTPEQKKAVRIWNNIVKTFPGSKEESEMGEIKQSASTWLARHFFLRAFDVGPGSPDAGKYVKIMEKLAKTRPRSVNDSHVFVSASPSALILGLWYRLNGMNEDARLCFRPSIKEALHILSDDDPDNDLQGFFQLVFAFLAAGDDENVIAIAHYCGTYDDAIDIDEDNQNENPRIVNIAPSSIKCDGSCNRVFHRYDDFAVCRYCYNIGFCESCMACVKNGTLPLNLCSKDHKWLIIPPKPQGISSRGSRILVSGVLTDIEDWKNGLKKQWQV